MSETAQNPSPGTGVPRRGLLVAGAAVALAIVLAVLLLGGDGKSALAEAAANVEGETSLARFDMQASEAGEEYSFAGEGRMSADGSGGEIDGTLTAAGQEPLTAKFRTIGDDLWMSSEQFNALPKGKRWIHSRDATSAPRTLTPSEFVRFLEGADEIEDLGEEPVLGTRATHYRGKLDIADLADETGGETAKRFEALLGGRDVSLPIDVWVTPDGLPKLMRIKIDAGPSFVRMEAEFLKFGVPVDVRPPPAGQVVEESELGG